MRQEGSAIPDQERILASVAVASVPAMRKGSQNQWMNDPTQLHVCVLPRVHILGNTEQGLGTGSLPWDSVGGQTGTDLYSNMKIT